MPRGQCNCESVAFEIDAEVSEVFVCHCSICRRATGSNGVAVVFIDKQVFHWTRGEELISAWKKPDGDWQIWFCRVCGSTLPGAIDEQVFVPAGLITSGGDSLRVAHHTWVDSRAVWDEIGDSGQQHPGAFKG